MRKVIIAFDGAHFSKGAFEFLRRLNESAPVLATGIFLPTVDYAELLYSIGGLSGPIYYQDVTNDDALVQKNIETFKSLCVHNGIEHRVHTDMERHVVAQLTMETRYADLLILGGEYFYENLGQDAQEDYVAETLHNAECPVVIVPEQYHFPENVVLSYDGSASSVFAIKQFAYLLPELTGLKTVLVHAGKGHADGDSIISMEELASRHFGDLTIQQLDIHNPKKYFNTWLEDNGWSILVAGAYGRSPMSQTLKSSFINEVIKDHMIPIFVAHR